MAGEDGQASGGKVVSLADAIGRFVRPGQVIQAGSGWGFPTALLYEIVRRFWGQDPGFTLVVGGAGSTNAVPFLRGGLVRRVVSSFAGDGYPHPGPNPVIQRARLAGAAGRTGGSARTGGAAGDAAAAPAGPAGVVEWEDWSLLTFTLRLMAGAMGLPFLPTRSLIGSDLGRDAEAAGLFRVVSDPFGAGAGGGDLRVDAGGTIGLVRALRPDISLAHAWAADPDGNALFTLPLAGNVYGALAARDGVILSAERIVDRAYVAAHSDLVRIPAHRVLAVVEAPFGAHPAGLHDHGVRDAAPGGTTAPREPTGYAEDREFILEAREACREDAAIDRWIRRWILDLPDHEAYLEQLGSGRLEILRGRLAEDSWPADLPSEWTGGEPPDAPLTIGERLIGLAAGIVAEEARDGGYATILAGVGAAHLASWLAREDLAVEGRAVELMAEIGLLGHRPYPGDPFVFSLRNVPTALMTTDILAVLGMLVPAPPGRCLGVIGAAQVDRYGNVNSSGMPAAGMWLVGSGGANDVASAAAAVVVVAAQSQARFVSEVPYVTSPGDRVVAIVSQWGVFRRLEAVAEPHAGGGRARGAGGQGVVGHGAGGHGACRQGSDGHGACEFALAAYFDDPSDPGPEAAIRRIKEKCGWDLEVFPDPQPLPPPEPDLTRRLRRFDPHGYLRF
jgi:acyl CoA:acetate/3-ketoacid CoA transferase alpha subunit/acyl CoA:acetate/3-ketoacid CoA transferase beta subunit